MAATAVTLESEAADKPTTPKTRATAFGGAPALVTLGQEAKGPTGEVAAVFTAALRTLAACMPTRGLDGDVIDALLEGTVAVVASRLRKASGEDAASRTWSWAVAAAPARLEPSAELALWLPGRCG